MTPFEIEILLYYYYSTEDDHPKKNVPIFNQTIQMFVRLGLIISTPNDHPCRYSYAGNREALKVYVDALGAVPLPVKQWVIPKE